MNRMIRLSTALASLLVPMSVSLSAFAQSEAPAVPVMVMQPAPDAQVVPPPGYGTQVVVQATPVAPPPGQTVAYVQQPPPAIVYPARHGFTFEAGLGFGYLSLSRDGASYEKGGVYGPTISLGAFLNPDLAIAFRFSGVTAFEEGGALMLSNEMASLQYFVTNGLSIGGGLGIMIARVSAGGLSVSSDPGFGGNLRAGLTLVDFGGSALRLATELNFGVIDSVRVATFGFGLEYQLF